MIKSKFNNFFKLVLLALCTFCIWSFANESLSHETKPRPHIWVKQSDREKILHKIETQQWAKSLYNELEKRVNFAVTSNNRRTALKELPFTQNNANLFPTLKVFRIKGGGTTAESRMLVKTVQDGVDCGVMYFLTTNKRYAECATDILYNIIRSLENMPVDRDLSKKGFRNKGWIYPKDHLYDARAIGAQLPIIYDFIYPYISSGGLAYNFHSGSLEPFDNDLAQYVFETYVWLALNNGPSTSNWPVFESPSLVHNILALNNKEKIANYLPFYTHVDSEKQTSLKTIAKAFKEKGDVWPESFQYSMAVADFSIYLMTLLDKYDSSLELGKKYPNIMAAFRTYYDIEFPNTHYPFLGDGHRAYSIRYHIHEMALMLAMMHNNQEEVEFYGSYLGSSLEDGAYKRGRLTRRYYGARPYLTPLQLLWQIDKIEYKQSIDLYRKRPRASDLPHAGVHIQRNTNFVNPEKNSLMAFVGGASYIHGHASGMDMELYGQGVVFGVDGGKGIYRTELHENYYRLFAAHNTVISNGASASSKDWLGLGINSVVHEFVEPKPYEEAVSPNYSFSITSFKDDFNLVAKADHQRTMALIKVSNTQGYYLDVFRAKSDSPDQYHDYVYHNFGDELSVKSNGIDIELQAQPKRYKEATDGKWIFHEKYNHPGWQFFRNIKTAPLSSDDLEIVFKAQNVKPSPIFMRALSPKGAGREITTVLAPPSKAAIAPYDKKALPTFLLRKQGEAWENPFVVLYESITDGEKFMINSANRLLQNGAFRGLKVNVKTGGEDITQYIIIQEDPKDTFKSENESITFTGRFGIVSINKNTGKGDMYIGNGSRLQVGQNVLLSNENKSGYAIF